MKIKILFYNHPCSNKIASIELMKNKYTNITLIRKTGRGGQAVHVANSSNDHGYNPAWDM